MIPRLHEVLTLTRPLVGLDLETTGVDARTDSIVELALEIMKPGAEPREYKTLVNPMQPIPPGATGVHGIKNSDVQDAPTFRQLAQNLAHGLTDCDLVGYNLRQLDLPLLVEEFRRAGIAWSYEGARIIDSHRLWQIAEGRTLSHAVERWLKPSLTDQEIYDELDKEGEAHDALWDTRMSTRVAAAQLRARPDIPRDLDALHALLWPGWYDAEGKLRWRDGELVIAFGKQHKNKPMREVPRGYLSWMIRDNFSETVKQACRDVLAGNPPVQPVDADAQDPD